MTAPKTHTTKSASEVTLADRVVRADDYDDDWDNGDCWNCGGEGFVADCFEEYACLYPEDGCDLCTRRCDVCRPRQALTQPGGSDNA